MPTINLNQSPEELEEQSRILSEEAARKRAEIAASAKSSKRTRKPVDQIDFEDMDIAMHKKLNEILDNEELILQRLPTGSRTDVAGSGRLLSHQSLETPHPATKINTEDDFDESSDNMQQPGHNFNMPTKKPMLPLSSGTKLVLGIGIGVILVIVVLHIIGVV